MPEFYRGKRVSVYRKQQQVGIDTSLSIASPILQAIQPSHPLDRMRLMKNFRGLVTIASGDATPYNNSSAGFIAFLRWPASESPQGSDIRMDASAVLHPVPYAMVGAPLTIAYEFKGITLGQEEKLWFCVLPSLSSGPIQCVWEMLWAQQDVVTP